VKSFASEFPGKIECVVVVENTSLRPVPSGDADGLLHRDCSRLQPVGFSPENERELIPKSVADCAKIGRKK
jgi:hypothetical protein